MLYRNNDGRINLSMACKGGFTETVNAMMDYLVRLFGGYISHFLNTQIVVQISN